MVFNSIPFVCFIIPAYAGYLLLQKWHGLQNRWLLLTSSFFYGWWDWRFLILLWITIAIDYLAAKSISRAQDAVVRSSFLAISVVGHLTILGFFKYAHFLVDNMNRLLALIHFPLLATPVDQILLPLGISFYTFQSISYVVDVYKKRIEPVQHLFDYAAFITYFPQLVAGPIERAAHLLPQILKPRVVLTREFHEGCYLIFWGLYQKMFVADNMARLVDPVFAVPGSYDSFSVWIAVYAFAFQIYCDFAGYSDIARGLGKWMGFDIIINFNLPYFSTNPKEFWQRWHISFSTWLRDYLYIPMGGDRRGVVRMTCNLIVTMLLGGLWHGARWTFVLWGLYHGILLIVYRSVGGLVQKWQAYATISNSKTLFFFRAVIFFHLVCFGWILFRSESVAQFGQIVRGLLGQSHLVGRSQGLVFLIHFLFFAGLFIAAQCYQRYKNDLFAVYKMPAWLRWLFYYAMLLSILFFGGILKQSPFIYFQF